jgi:hypothetical protein
MTRTAGNSTEKATERDWEQVRDAYIQGEGSLNRLAQRYGLPLSTVEARSRREGWVVLRQKRKQAALERVVGTSPTISIGGVTPVKDSDWWTKQGEEHLLQNLEVTRRLRHAVDKKIGEATATELEKLGGALESVVEAERKLLELTPRSAKDKSPTLRPVRRPPSWDLPPPTPVARVP